MLTVITGDHIRHLYLINYLSQHFEVDNWIIQKKKIRKNLQLKSFQKFQKLEKIHFRKKINLRGKIFESKKRF